MGSLYLFLPYCYYEVSKTCISLSSCLLELRGLGAYGGRVLAMLVAEAAMTAMCSSESKAGDEELNVSGDTSELRINYVHQQPMIHPHPHN